jgi:hypothetical protein
MSHPFSSKNAVIKTAIAVFAQRRIQVATGVALAAERDAVQTCTNLPAEPWEIRLNLNQCFSIQNPD